MAKGIGLIGNFKGKVGNTVGYKLTASNNGQTQGIRVYQPIVKNPKSAGQAEQRAKLLAVNATYRALKMVIDRGNEALPYGNKSRLAWLKSALKAEGMPWFEKGSVATYPVLCPISKGSINAFTYLVEDVFIDMNVPGLAADTDVKTVAKLTTALLAANPSLKEGDQLTFVAIQNTAYNMLSNVESIVLDSTDNTALTQFNVEIGKLHYQAPFDVEFGAIILSRQGANGEHLRSSASLVGLQGATDAAPYNEASKAAAIASYRASAASNSDWAEESIQ